MKTMIVDDEPLAHGAGIGVGNQRAGFGVLAHQIQGAADHFAAGGADDGVGLRVN